MSPPPEPPLGPLENRDPSAPRNLI